MIVAGPVAGADVVAVAVAVDVADADAEAAVDCWWKRQG